MDRYRRAATPPRRRWFAGWRGRGTPGGRDDPADQGTAFGLEMILLSQAEALAPVSASQPARRAPWWRRRR